MQIAKDTVVQFNYRIKELDGTELEDSYGHDPIAFLCGHNNMMPGVEKALLGKKVGDSFSVELAAAETYGELQEDWESHWDEVATLDLSGKIVALYGMGDQVGYSEWFQDALGMLHDLILPCGAQIIGYWPNQGYEFSASKALSQDQAYFVGLSIDDENQYRHRCFIGVADCGRVWF